MRILLILGHPDPNSFNHAIADTARAVLCEMGYEVRLRDLYAERFDPILETNEIPQSAGVPDRIDEYCRELQEADGIIVVHPNWWGQPPAIVKGWIDRVVRPGVAYRFDEGDNGEGVPVGLLKAKAAVVFNTSNTPEDREFAVFGDPLENIWKKCIFDLCGVPDFHRRMFQVVVSSNEDRRRQWLQEVSELCRRVF